MAHLLLFASAREAAGEGRVLLSGGTVGEVLKLAVDRFGQDFNDVLRHSSVLLDGERVDEMDLWSVDVTDVSEIAVLPPVSGGACAAWMP